VFRHVPFPTMAMAMAMATAMAMADRGKAWRVLQVVVDAADDPGKDGRTPSKALLQATARTLRMPEEALQADDVRVARKSFDARGGRARFVYVVDVDAKKVRLGGGRTKQARRVRGIDDEKLPTLRRDVDLRGLVCRKAPPKVEGEAPHVVVVGCGPAGLFAALVLVEGGARVTLVERGAPVERRARDIGALFTRKKLHEESNLCFGEGGAGTWSDGKLTTRIGKNADNVRIVLETLVRFGAPESILVDGKPHLGTDRLVKILQAFRKHLQGRGCAIRFQTRVEEVLVSHHAVAGVRLSDGSVVRTEKVVLATGHSSRELYRSLEASGVALEAKPFAAGFRIEHPQELIDRIQYGPHWANMVMRGKGHIPVADYKLATTVNSDDKTGVQEESQRGVYSFCMCPGGQIVPTSVDPKHLCVNGMSFSRRNSQWANSALVVTVNVSDFGSNHALAGLDFQESIEMEAAERGGGDLRAPVQRAVDFMSNAVSPEGKMPTSSYRLGVRSSRLEDIYPESMTVALKAALLEFEERMPGFIGESALLHGVETRTSSPVRITRCSEDLQSSTIKGLYPCGEGAGYAGGIVSAAVDGLQVGRAIRKTIKLPAPI